MSVAGSNRWLLVRSGAGETAFNMGLDEALLEAMPRIGRPVLRLYGWKEAAASFGYFQRFVDIERLTPLRPLVRRPTAGGIVPHAADWTYSVMVPSGHPWYGLKAAESYQRMHEWLRAAFARCEVETRLAPEPLRSGPGLCFAGYEQFDLLWRGRKMAGAAQRRKREGLLIQGSVQPGEVTVLRQAWESAMCVALSEVEWETLEPEGPLADRASELARTKYSQPSYNQRR